MSNVAISRALSLLICIFSLTISFAQGRTITGTITDENNNPLAGATVSIKDTRILTQTNANGRFSLNAPASAKTLTVTYVGTKPQEIAIGSQDDYVIKMSSTGSAMNEVVVIGYGTAKRANIATSISSVSEKDI